MSKKLVVSLTLSQQIENENMDSIYLQKYYGINKGKKKALKTLDKFYSDMKKFIIEELGDDDTNNTYF